MFWQPRGMRTKTFAATQYRLSITSFNHVNMVSIKSHNLSDRQFARHVLLLPLATEFSLSLSPRIPIFYTARSVACSRIRRFHRPSVRPMDCVHRSKPRLAKHKFSKIIFQWAPYTELRPRKKHLMSERHNDVIDVITEKSRLKYKIKYPT